MEEIRQLDRKTGKLLTLQRMHHPKADMDRMYLLRNEGGRGLIQLQTAYKTATIGLDTYLDTKNDPLLMIAKEPEKKNKEKSIHILPGNDFQFSTSLKHWNLKMKLWLSMPEKLDRKQGAMPKINWNKNGKINQCMGNTKKSKGKRCWPSNDQPMTEDSCAQVRNRPWLYYYCLRSGHQDQLLS